MAAQNSVLTQIARPYASALFDLAQSENQMASVETSLSDVSRLIGESADFAHFLRSPVIAADNKAQALDQVLARSSTNPLVANFLRLVAKNGLLIVPGVGSFVLLGEVVTTLAIDPDPPMAERCGACTR